MPQLVRNSGAHVAPGRAALVEALLYAALLSLAASRALLRAVGGAVRAGFFVPARRWSVLLAQHAQDLLRAALERRYDPILVRFLLHDAPDLNRRRLHLVQAAEQGVLAYRTSGKPSTSRRGAA